MQVLLAEIRNCAFSMQKRGEHLLYLTSICIEKVLFMIFARCACIIQTLLKPHVRWLKLLLMKGLDKAPLAPAHQELMQRCHHLKLLPPTNL